MQVMPVIHARAKSEEAAFAMVMLVPVVATTRVGNIDAANRSTRSSADALLARNGRRSLSVSLEAKKSAISVATTPAQATERSVPRAGSRVGAMPIRAYALTATNSVMVMHAKGQRSLAARACRSDGFSALSAIQVAP